jgi:succinyl-diaminopimelate desuccinylase
MEDLTERALAHLDTAALEHFLVALVQTPSVYLPGVPGANEEEAARRVFELLRGWGWSPRWEEVAPGRPNVIAELRGSLGPGPLLLMEGHTDVVTPGDLAAWRDDPFAGRVEGRTLYGRGACDMKGGLTAMLFAARALQLAGAPFAGTLRLLVPVDEEGMMLGVKALVARGHADGAVGCIVCEPEGGELCVAQKGSLRLRLLSYGRIAHGAMPHTGVNALAGMVRWLGRVLELEGAINAEHGAHPLLGPCYISPTVARAPLSGDASQLNCLPDLCDAFLDIRTAPPLEHPALIARIEALAEAVRAEHPAHRFAVELIDDRPATEIDPAHPLARAVAEAHARVYGAPPPLGGVPGSTDGTIIARERGVPVVVYGPGDKWLPHQPNEHVDLDEVAQAARVYIIAALRLLGGATPLSSKGV